MLFLWNPVVLYETIGQGHNDVAMLFWMLLAVWLLLQKRYTLTIVALLIGALFKYIPVLFIPAALAIALRDLGSTRSRLRYLGVTAIVSIVLVLLAYAPFWNGLETLSITRRMNLYTTSLPAVAYNLLQFSLSHGRCRAHGEPDGADDHGDRRAGHGVARVARSIRSQLRPIDVHPHRVLSAVDRAVVPCLVCRVDHRVGGAAADRPCGALRVASLVLRC